MKCEKAAVSNKKSLIQHSLDAIRIFPLHKTIWPWNVCCLLQLGILCVQTWIIVSIRKWYMENILWEWPGTWLELDPPTAWQCSRRASVKHNVLTFSNIFLPCLTSMMSFIYIMILHWKWSVSRALRRPMLRSIKFHFYVVHLSSTLTAFCLSKGLQNNNVRKEYYCESDNGLSLATTTAYGSPSCMRCGNGSTLNVSTMIWQRCKNFRL